MKCDLGGSRCRAMPENDMNGDQDPQNLSLSLEGSAGALVGLTVD